MQRIQRFIDWASVLSQISHIFCCGLPVLFSVLSLLSSLGFLVVMPSGLMSIHDIMHDYEMPMMITAGVIVLFGWVLHYISWRIDCLKTGCEHEPCGTKKKRSSKLLAFATFLFLVNLSGYLYLGH
jgi:hypothetical protein